MRRGGRNTVSVSIGRRSLSFIKALLVSPWFVLLYFYVVLVCFMSFTYILMYLTVCRLATLTYMSIFVCMHAIIIIYLLLLFFQQGVGLHSGGQFFIQGDGCERAVFHPANLSPAYFGVTMFNFRVYFSRYY